MGKDKSWPIERCEAATNKVGFRPAKVRSPQTLTNATTDRASNTLTQPSGVFACIPAGAVCCPDGISYAVPPETCQEGTQASGNAGAHATSESDSGADNDDGGNDAGGDSNNWPGNGLGKGSGDADNKTPITTGPPQPASTGGLPHVGLGPGGPTLGPSVSHFGQHWFTFVMTWHYFSYYYSRVDEDNTMLASSEVACTTAVSVTATDAAQASQYFTSISASVVLPTPTQTHTPVVTWIEAPVPTTVLGPSNGVNGTAPTTRLPSAVVTAGAAALGGFAGAVAAVAGLVLGLLAGML
jgi:hypothetical protein